MNERQLKILSLLVAEPEMRVARLSEALGVSPVTVRSDLDALAREGRVERLHGGARLADGRTRQELTFAQRRALFADRKRRIAQAAAGLIAPGEAVLLDASSTAVALAAEIKGRMDLADLTVVTTGIWTALELLDSPGIHVVLAGGLLRDATGSTTGQTALENLARFNISRAFLGAWGVTIEQGLMDSSLPEVELKRAVVERAREVVAIVDGSKFGRLAVGSFAAVEQVRSLVTDPSAPGEMLAALRDRGVIVQVG